MQAGRPHHNIKLKWRGDFSWNTGPWYTPENRRRVLDILEKLKPIADGHNATLAQVAVNWVVSQRGITSALVGARNERQVTENAGAANFKLSNDEVATIRKLGEGLGAP